MKRVILVTNLLAGFCFLNCVCSHRAQAQLLSPATGGQTVLTYVNRLIVNPPEVAAFGYFTGVTGLPDPLFAGAAGESTAYFTWYLNAPEAVQIANGDAALPGSTGVAVLPAGESFSVYYNATPNQSWANPGSFSAGQLIATFKSTPGTQTGSGPVALVTQSYVLVSSRPFVFKGETYNLARLLPHGFTFFTLSSNIPLGGSPVFPLVFTAAGSGVAIGGELSALPRLF